MHWHLDVTFREDGNTTLDKQAAPEPEYNQEMESEHIENDRNHEAGIVSEKEAFCDQPSANTVSGRSIIFLKDMD